MNKAKKEFEESKTKVVAETREWFNWYESRVSDKNKWLRTTLLLKSNAKDFKTLFGSQDFCTLDSASRRLWVWRQELPSGSIWLITDSNERGTSYEVTEGTNWLDIQDFFEKLIDKLSTLNDD